MITVSESIQNIVRESPLLEEGLGVGIINLSALARRIRPQVESQLLKPVSDSAVMMALKRLSEHIQKNSRQQAKFLKGMGDITVRSSLSEFTFQISDTILEREKQLLHEIAGQRDRFVTFTQGLFEITVIVSTDLEKNVESVFAHEKRIAKLNGLSAIVLKLPAATVHMPGVHYSILKQLAWDNINVIEEVSTYTEYTIIIEKNKVDRAFSILKGLFWL